jgi:D-beta-D-heptose 7-phosphate kinase/D-beta-D-heptose 1-phosphate adenosyltransferase
MPGAPATDSAALAALLDRFTRLSAWVIGDVMLDEYLDGAVDRISPEAPVPIVRALSSTQRLGGAANVAHQLTVLGVNTRLAGAIGCDTQGDDILRLCTTHGIDTRSILRRPGQRTTHKMRVLGQSQQLMRLDVEDREPCEPELTDQLIRQLQAGPSPDVILLSDYAKGVLTPHALEGLLRNRSAQRAPIVVDPKHRDFERYRGATVLTPNLHELEIALDRPLDPDATETITLCARALAAASGIKHMVVTLGSRGLLVVPAEKSATAIPAIRRPVYDVTGVGDTLAAVLAASLAADEPLEVAAAVANIAASVVVGKIGTVAVSGAEILAASDSQSAVSGDSLA